MTTTTTPLVFFFSYSNIKISSPLMFSLFSSQLANQLTKTSQTIIRTRREHREP